MRMCNAQPIDALTPAFGFHTACILDGGDIADQPSEPVEKHLLGLNLTAFDPAGWKSRSVAIYIEELATPRAGRSALRSELAAAGPQRARRCAESSRFKSTRL